MGRNGKGMKEMQEWIKVGSGFSMAAAFILLAFVLSGCAMFAGPGPAPRYFLLTSTDNGSIQPHGTGSSTCTAAFMPSMPEPCSATSVPLPVIVGPVEIPAYLDRPQIVRRIQDSMLSVSELNRWAEPLDRGIERVVAGDISRQSRGCFNARPFSLVAPGEAGLSGPRVLITCYSFEQHGNGEVVLDAGWSIFFPDGNASMIGRRDVFTAMVHGPGMDSTVGAMNEVLSQLSKAVMDDLQRLVAVTRSP